MKKLLGLLGLCLAFAFSPAYSATLRVCFAEIEPGAENGAWFFRVDDEDGSQLQALQMSRAVQVGPGFNFDEPEYYQASIWQAGHDGVSSFLSLSALVQTTLSQYSATYPKLTGSTTIGGLTLNWLGPLCYQMGMESFDMTNFEAFGCHLGATLMQNLCTAISLFLGVVNCCKFGFDLVKIYRCLRDFQARAASELEGVIRSKELQTNAS